ncbi:hypothetical protein Y032_0012g1770 [Ancylostoma ceylanicum]|uniref:Uncharacterized protein n=1 Tax=Ancylostoma ceylanicum TaxID=53326 RepID=A0A016VCR7_9BILA|nr:hypothetical protein Y032_0012g1770 [Ancylostoma ceylanicum]
MYSLARRTWCAISVPLGKGSLALLPTPPTGSFGMGGQKQVYFGSFERNHIYRSDQQSLEIHQARSHLASNVGDINRS